MSKPSKESFINFLVGEIAIIKSLSASDFGSHTVLIGAESEIKSRELVELLLAIEDHLEDNFDVEFDWASDSAMSQARSRFRSVDTLADHLLSLIENEK